MQKFAVLRTLERVTGFLGMEMDAKVPFTTEQQQVYDLSNKAQFTEDIRRSPSKINEICKTIKQLTPTIASQQQSSVNQLFVREIETDIVNLNSFNGDSLRAAGFGTDTIEQIRKARANLRTTLQLLRQAM